MGEIQIKHVIRGNGLLQKTPNYSKNLFSSNTTKEADKSMSDLNRGIMKFEGADSPKVVTISTVLLLGSIVALIIWALQVAYAVN